MSIGDFHLDLIEHCQICGNNRSAADVLLECQCRRRHIYTRAEEDRILHEFTHLKKLLTGLGIKPEIEQVDTFIEYLRIIDHTTARLTSIENHASLMKKIYTVISRTRSDRRVKNKALYQKYKYMPVSIAQLIKYPDCIYVTDNAICSHSGEILCFDHRAVFYTAHTELLIAGFSNKSIHTILEYLLPDYDQIPGCVPSMCKSYFI